MIITITFSDSTTVPVNLVDDLSALLLSGRYEVSGRIGLGHNTSNILVNGIISGTFSSVMTFNTAKRTFFLHLTLCVPRAPDIIFTKISDVSSCSCLFSLTRKESRNLNQFFDVEGSMVFCMSRTSAFIVISDSYIWLTRMTDVLLSVFTMSNVDSSWNIEIFRGIKGEVNWHEISRIPEKLISKERNTILIAVKPVQLN